MAVESSTADWTGQAIERLAASTPGGYHGVHPVATEPTALAALALRLWRNHEAAERACAWLLDNQAKDGSFGVDAKNRKPCWPTGWAVLALLSSRAEPLGPGNALAGTGPVRGEAAGGAFRESSLGAADNAVRWLLKLKARQAVPSTEAQRIFGHDITLEGWPWVESTTPWVEPTAMALLALRRAGKAGEGRFREGVKLLLDRQLADGGWNFGNTTVFGNTLPPHLQATGLTLWALAGEEGIGARIQRSLDYLVRSLDARTTTVSLCYGLIGLSAHHAAPVSADAWLQSAATRTLAGDGSPCQLALLLLASRRKELIP